MTVKSEMAISKTSTLLVALFTGFVSLLLQTIALSTDYWTCSTFRGPVQDFYTHNGSVIDPPRSLVRNRGLWRMCQLLYTYDNTTEIYTSNTSTGITATAQPIGIPETLPDSTLQCGLVNLSEPPGPAAYGSNFFKIMYYCEKTAAIVACVCVGLQFCGFLTSIQGAWTMMTVLFTDCGIMYLFAAITGLLCMALYMISFSYETNEVDELLQFLMTIYYSTVGRFIWRGWRLRSPQLAACFTFS
ncbi:uncharacterized protein [Amphiura filiformis]|uniref:uncharacterized protein n=1 Tax=Amphiura filiformis TaxID=82378 RepID=UPI003B22489C